MKTKAKRVKYYIIRFSPNGTTFQVRLGKVHIIFALFVTEYYTEKLLSSLKNQSYNTQQELFTELYAHDSFPSWNDLSSIA